MGKNRVFRILYLNTEHEMGGGEWSLLYLVEKLDRKRFLPIVVCTSKGTLVDELNSRNIKVIISSLGRLKSFNQIPVIKTIVKLIKIIKTEQIDLIHTNDPRSNLLGGIVGRLTGRPIVWHARNFIVQGMVDTDRIFSFLTNKIIANSVAVSKRFERLKDFKKKVEVIYNGVNLEKFNSGIDGSRIRKEFNIPDGVPIVGILSRIGPGKGHEYFINAASIVRKSIPEVKFLVVGGPILEADNNELKELIKLAEDLGLYNDIIFAGHRSDIPDIMASLDLVVLATEAEPFGRVAIEAMATSKPVVATNAGGIPEVVEDKATGILVPPKDVDAMANTIIGLINDRHRMKELGENGRKRAIEMFSIESNVKKTGKVYENLL